MSRRTEPRPFWSNPQPPSRISGSWAALVAAAGEVHMPKYDRAARYELGAAIEPEQFGVGVVIALPKVGVMEVRFEGRVKLLAFGSRG